MKKLLSCFSALAVLLCVFLTLPLAASAADDLSIRVLNDFEEATLTATNSSIVSTGGQGNTFEAGGFRGSSLKMESTTGGWLEYNIYSYDATGAAATWRDEWQEATYLQFWVKNAGSGNLTVALTSMKKDSGAIDHWQEYDITEAAQFTGSADGATWTNLSKQLNGNGVYEAIIPGGFEGFVRVELSTTTLSFPDTAWGLYDGQIGKLEMTFGLGVTTVFIDDVALAGTFTDTVVDYQFASLAAYKAGTPVESTGVKMPAAMESVSHIRVLQDFSEAARTEANAAIVSTGYQANTFEAGGLGNSTALKMYNDNDGWLEYNIYSYDAAGAAATWRDEWQEAKYLQFWVKNAGPGVVNVSLTSMKKDSGALDGYQDYRITDAANFVYSTDGGATWYALDKQLNGNGIYEVTIPSGFEGYIRVAVDSANLAFPDTAWGLYDGQIGKLEMTFGVKNSTVYIDDVALAGNFTDTVNGYQFAVSEYPHIHSWKAATCTAAKTCSTCGATEGEALGHSWKAATCTAAKTCSTCGATEGEALGHSYFYPCDPVCQVCGELSNPDATHSIQHVAAVAKTCYENGNIEYWYCTDCGTAWADEALTMQTNRMSVVVPMAHAEATHVAAVAATCYEDGNIEYWYCADCGQAWLDAECTLNTNLKAVVLPAAHTNLVHFDAVEAACHYTGNIEYWVCYGCETVWQDEALTQITNVKNVIIPALESTATYVPAKEATIFENGNEAYWTCDQCQQVWANEALTQLTNIKNVTIGAVSDWYEAKGKTYYYVNGAPVKGLYCIDGEYYFFNTGSFRMMSSIDIWVSVSNPYGLEAGVYALGEDGKLQVTKNGFLTTGDTTFYYVNDEKLLGFQEIDGAIYYFNKGSGAMQKNCNIWLPSTNEFGLTPGNYTLGADGKLQLTGFVNPTPGRVFYRDNGELVKGLYEIDGQYYFFNTGSGAMVTNTSIWVPHGNAYGLPAAHYYIEANGVILM